LADKIGFCPLIIEAATDNLLYLTFMQVNTRTKLSHNTYPLKILAPL